MNTKDPKQLGEVTELMLNAEKCVSSRYEDYSIGYEQDSNLEKFTVNTKGRFDAYEKYGLAMNGMTFTLKDGDTCEK